MAAPWRPEAELADFAAEQFDVEGRATEILKVVMVVLAIIIVIVIVITLISIIVFL